MEPLLAKKISIKKDRPERILKILADVTNTTAKRQENCLILERKE
ncbi:hypothetical protein wVul_1085 [Wolbachia endosymbiont of Armadillidium vulgare str. wVulC]|nr:hypothetical protein wVul_1085 [Wolbachia endosymbiont of Armadillidium vulgare str. wVulC]